MTKNRFVRSALQSALCVFLFTLFVGVTSLAQETTGTIQGTIKDAAGAAIPGATVKVDGAAFSRSATTNSDGFYRMLQVPPGIYKITVTATNFSTGNIEGVTVVLGKTVETDIALKVGSVSEQVVITSDDVARIDPNDNKIQTNITTRTIEALPKGTNMTSLLKVAPAARQEALSGGFQIDGASGSENSFIIDGMEVSNFRTGVLNTNNNLPFQFVQEIQIKTSGFEAEYGGATGGVVNVVTKGGSNEFHGEVGYEFEPSSLFSGPRPLLNVYRQGTAAAFRQFNDYLRPERDSFTNHFPSFALGGPVAKDRLWFLASYAPQIFDTTRTVRYFTQNTSTSGAIVPNATNAASTYTTNVRQEYFSGRLDAAPMNKLRLSATYIWNPIIQDGIIPQGNITINAAPPGANFGGTIGNLVGPALTDRQGGRQNSNNIATQAVYTPSSNLVTTFRFSRAFLNEKLNSYFIPRVTRFQCLGLQGPAAAGCDVNFQNVTNNSNLDFDASVRRTFEADASYIVNKFAGRHEFKGGYQNIKVSNEVRSGYKDTGRVLLYYGFTLNDLAPIALPETPTAIGAGILRRFATEGQASNNAHSIYFQDRWQPTGRLSINAGVRFEKENLPSFNGYAPPINFGFGDKVVPRLGFAYQLTGDGKTKLFASFGQFTDRLKFELPRGSFGGDFFRDDYFEILPANPRYDYYTIGRILGSNQDNRGGGVCPIPNSTGLTRCQADFRIASNDPAADLFTGKVDPNLKPFRQTEFTAGFERELSRSFLLSIRYSYKNVNDAIEDAGFPTPAGSEAYIIGNPGKGLHKEVAQQFGYSKTVTPQRRYDALEIKFDRRFSNNYFFQTNYTYSRLYGNYSGLASSDENGRTSPGVNRFFDLPHLGFTAEGKPDNGRLPTDRPHVFNAYGSYNFDWFGKIKGGGTQFGMFTTIQSGTPLTSYYTLYAESILKGRGDLGRTPVFTNTDFNIQHRFNFGSEKYSMTFNFNVLNLFNEANVLGVNRTPAAINPTPATLRLPNTDEPAALKQVLNSGILNEFNAFLNDPAFPQRKNTAFGLANNFQGVRQIRLGVRFVF